MFAPGQALNPSASEPGGLVRVANGYVQLVVHVLAHVPLTRAGNLYDPRYRAWAAARHGGEALEFLAHDAQLLARAWAVDPRMDRLHTLFALHDTLDGFRATATRELAELGDREVARPGLLTELRELPLAELLHASLAVLDRPWAAIFATIEPELRGSCQVLARAILPLREVLPSFAAQSIELVWGLGVHGRAFDQRVLVGAPATWNGSSPLRQAILAAHEHCVARSEHSGYIAAEWDALRDLARRMRALEHPSLRRAHAAWLASLDLDELLAGLVARGQLGRDQAELLRSQPERRASVLAQPSVLSP